MKEVVEKPQKQEIEPVLGSLVTGQVEEERRQVAVRKLVWEVRQQEEVVIRRILVKEVFGLEVEVR